MDTINDPSAQRLRAYLNEARSTVLWKCEALSEELARRPMTPTGTHMLGIVHHLAVTEYGYFGECLGLLPNDDHVLELLQSEDSQIDFASGRLFGSRRARAVPKIRRLRRSGVG